MSEEPLANKNQTAPALPDAEYDLIYATVSETAQGRRFLEEHARRTRPSDLDASLAAIERIQTAIRAQSTGDRTDLLLEMAEMAQAILRVRAEIGAMQLPGTAPLETTEELDSIVKATERATSQILASAEQVQEIAWTLREAGANSALCDLLDAQATDIYTTCSFQDLTGQRTRKVIQVLRYLEDRINATVTAREKEPEGESLKQPQVDAMLQDDRQDATLEDISRAMLSMGPTIEEPPAGETADPPPVQQDMRPELSVADTILAETEAAGGITEQAAEPPGPGPDPASPVKDELPPIADRVVEDPSAPKSEWEPAWVILHRLQAEEHRGPEAMPQMTHPHAPEPEESGLFVAEAMSQLAQTLRPSPLLPPPELDFRGGRKLADPLVELQTAMAEIEMTLLPLDDHGDDVAARPAWECAATDEEAAAAEATAEQKPAEEERASTVQESDPDAFLFEPEGAAPAAAPEKTEAALPAAALPAEAAPAAHAPKAQSSALPSAARLNPPSAAAPEKPAAPPEPAQPYDPLAPLRALSDAQKIALFS